MKAITIWQPWATFIARGLKTIETRTHDRLFCLRGEKIAIHAARRPVLPDELSRISNDCDRLGRVDVSLWMCDHGFEPAHYPLGAIVAVATVAEARELTDAEAPLACCVIEDNCFGLVLRDVIRFERPVSCKGSQGIWRVPPDVHQHMRDCYSALECVHVEGGAPSPAVRPAHGRGPGDGDCKRASPCPKP